MTTTPAAISLQSNRAPSPREVGERWFRRDSQSRYLLVTEDFVLPRSGLAIKHGVTCVNAPGLIDPGYRGEVKVALVNLDPKLEYVVQRVTALRTRRDARRLR